MEDDGTARVQGMKGNQIKNAALIRTCLAIVCINSALKGTISALNLH